MPVMRVSFSISCIRSMRTSQAKTAAMLANMEPMGSYTRVAAIRNIRNGISDKSPRLISVTPVRTVVAMPSFRKDCAAVTTEPVNSSPRMVSCSASSSLRFRSAIYRAFWLHALISGAHSSTSCMASVAARRVTSPFVICRFSMRRER